MIRAGEASGELPEVLSRLSYIMEHEYKVKSDVRSALQYPLIVLVFLFIAFLVLLTFVIPRFATIFEKAGIDLPIPTQICIMLYHFLFHYWYLIAIFFLGFAGLLYYFGVEKGRYVRDHLLTRLPLIGPLFIKAAMSRFASIFAILQFSGVGVLESLRILSKTIGNVAIAKELDAVREQIAQGSTIAGPLKSAKYFTPMTVHMIGVGEASGNLDEMLREVSNHYDSEVAYAMDRLSEAIGPLLTILLAALVGFFALAIFLPMWDLAQVVK
jgi:type IV pilus assembly protein PilC